MPISKAKVVQRLFAAVCVALICTTGLLAQKVTKDYNKSQDFYRYNTYFWANVKAPNDLWTQRIKDTVEAQLEKRGWKKVDANGMLR